MGRIATLMPIFLLTGLAASPALGATRQDLMDREDESLPDAMRRVQLEKIIELRSEGDIDHPFTWGAFIALGDWR